MNKTNFIEELSKQVNLDVETCSKINNILEHNFFISKKNKDLIISCLIKEIGVNEEKANEIYNAAASNLTRELKDKLLHPFKGQD